jgi:thiopeptide-type bacteriocin biosynthesis protein
VKPSASKSELLPASRFVLRTPLLAFDEIVAWGAETEGVPAEAEACARARARLAAALDRPEVREALFLASPNLVARMGDWLRAPETQDGQKIERALVRYFSRMAGRATPFGLFSGLSVGRLGERTAFEIAGRQAYERRTRLDNDYLFALCAALRKDPSIRRALRFRPSSSLYRSAGKLRYVEARLRGKLRSYHLVAVRADEYLEVALTSAAGGATVEEIARALLRHDPEIEAADAEAFVEELIDGQLLTSDLDPAVTGPEPLQHILTRLREVAPQAEAVRRLDAAAAVLADVDGSGVGIAIDRYRAVAEGLTPLPSEVDLSRMFQVDLVKPAPIAVLGPEVVAEIVRAIELLRRIFPSPEAESLESFARAFTERYEDREVPLLEALDEESGIGFETSRAPAAVGAPLLANITFPSVKEAERVRWGAVERFLLRKLQGVWSRGERELVLSDDELAPLLRTTPSPLPDVLSAMASVAAESAEAVSRGDFELLFSSAAGPSGAELLGRFCHASADVHAHVEALLRAEEAARPDAIFAEIVHLNQGRIGNILCRPVLRDHEIPYLGVSGAPEERQIPVQDLLVSVRGGRVVLRSRRLDREVVPRMSTAHNFRLQTVVVYRFLCALGQQGHGVFHFRFGALESAPFLPRVRHGRLILARARWLLDEHDLAPLAEAARAAKRADTPAEILAAREAVFDAAQGLRQELALPRYVVVADGDNELPVDLDNALSVDSAASIFAQRKLVVLRELYPAPDRLVARAPEGRFVHELLVSFTRKGAPVRTGVPPKTASSPRRFAPGSAWLYAKLYAGPSTIDDVLRRAIAPVRTRALASGAARRWFFVRYRDSADHLRVRFEGDPARLSSEVLPALEKAVAPLLADGSVFRMALDTYEREVERYGGPDGIELSEEIFFHDSEAALEILSSFEGDAWADARWRLSLHGADRLLVDLGLDLATRAAVVLSARDGMRLEHSADSALYEQIGARFRRERDALFPLIQGDLEPFAAGDLGPGIAAYRRRSERLRPVVAELQARERAGRLSASLREMASAFMHMHHNRMLHAAQRAQELVLYDFLSRCYASMKSRSRGGA